MLFWVLAIFLVVGLTWFGLPVMYRQIATTRLEALCREHRAIVLSYDDGPSASLSPVLSDLLVKSGVRATFFMIGAYAEQHQGIVSHLQAVGHEIGSHTQNHSNAWKTLPWVGIRDFAGGQQTLARLGVPTRLFRPPFGKTTPAMLLAGLGQYFAFWTVDPQDSWDRRPVADILAEIDRKGGGVVLMHDFDLPRRGPTPEAHPAYLLELTEALVAFAAARGYRILRLGDLIDARKTGASA